MNNIIDHPSHMFIAVYLESTAGGCPFSAGAVPIEVMAPRRLPDCRISWRRFNYLCLAFPAALYYKYLLGDICLAVLLSLDI